MALTPEDASVVDFKIALLELSADCEHLARLSEIDEVAPNPYAAQQLRADAQTLREAARNFF